MGFSYIANNDTDSEQKIFESFTELADWFEIDDKKLEECLENGEAIVKYGKKWLIDILV